MLGADATPDFNAWRDVLTHWSFWSAGFAICAGALLGLYGVAVNEKIDDPLKIIFSFFIAGGAFFGILVDAKDRHDALLENLLLQESVDRLGSPIANTAITYNVLIPTQNPQLRLLNEAILRTSREVEFKFNHMSPPMGVLPRMPLTDILKQLAPEGSPTDVSASFLRSVDVDVELYRPPFPAQTNYYTGFYAYGRPDLLLSTDYVSQLPQDMGKSDQLPKPFGETPIRSSPFTIWLCDECTGTDWFKNPAPYVSAYGMPIARADHTRRLDSLVDLAGSRLFVHVRPDAFSSFNSAIMEDVRLRLYSLTIDGINYHFNQRKAIVGKGPLFTYYEFTFPANWDSQKQTIP